MDKIIIIGGGRQGPTYRNRLYMDALLEAGFDVEYRSFDDGIVGKEAKLIEIDFSGIEARFLGRPDILAWDDPMKEPPPDQRKGPKGPRNRWGNIR